jgi:hypothetical protein
MVISADTWEQGEYYTKDFDLISSDIYIYLQFKVSESGPQLLQPGLIRQNRWSSQYCIQVFRSRNMKQGEHRKYIRVNKEIFLQFTAFESGP